MRGVNHEQDYIFTYHSPADRVQSDHPLRIIKEMANRGLKELSAEFHQIVLADRPRLDSSGKPHSSLVTPSVVLHPQRTASDGRTELRLVISLVLTMECSNDSRN